MTDFSKWEVDPSVAGRILHEKVGEEDPLEYAEAEASIVVANPGAEYLFDMRALCAYRTYLSTEASDNSRYEASVGLASSEQTFRWDVRGEARKTLGFDVEFSPVENREEGVILTDEVKHTYSTSALGAYELWNSNVSAIDAIYTYSYFLEKTDLGSNRTWQVHTGSLGYENMISDRTTFLLTASHSLQISQEEEGRLYSVVTGVEYLATELTSFLLTAGPVYYEYDIAGTGFGTLVNLEANWQATSETAVTLFAENGYQSGYDGGVARLVNRFGYSASILPPRGLFGRLDFLHNYQRLLIDGAEGEWMHFVQGTVGWRSANDFFIQGSLRWVYDGRGDGLLAQVGLAKRY